LAPYGARAREYKDGIIDLSVGTPVDATPDFIQTALKAAANAPGYPLTIGSPALRESMRNWATNILGVTGEFDLLPSIGSKEVVASLPTQLQAESVLYPKIAYPTYLVSAILAKAEHHSVDFDAAVWPVSDFVWINSPSNPTGRISSREELQAVIAYSRRAGAVIASDECYFNFPARVDGVQPISLLQVAGGDNKNLIALHSLSKRSNLAGYRGGMIIGDPLLIAKIREIRKHSGLLVPAPIQAAMIAALEDETHVHQQAQRYAQRRDMLRPALATLGFVVEHSEAGLYIWCTRGERDMDSVSFFAENGILVTPGGFYGEAGSRHIRIALTATDAQIAAAATRILK
jgi:succinyldiaminopimelate transaminase